MIDKRGWKHIRILRRCKLGFARIVYAKEFDDYFESKDMKLTEFQKEQK